MFCTKYEYPTELLIKFSKEELNRFGRCIDNIEKNLWEIMLLKYSKMKMPIEKYIEKTSKMSIYEAMNLDSIGFYYMAHKSMVENFLVKVYVLLYVFYAYE